MKNQRKIKVLWLLIFGVLSLKVFAQDNQNSNNDKNLEIEASHKKILEVILEDTVNTKEAFNYMQENNPEFMVKIDSLINTDNIKNEKQIDSIAKKIDEQTLPTIEIEIKMSLEALRKKLMNDKVYDVLNVINYSNINGFSKADITDVWKKGIRSLDYTGFLNKINTSFMNWFGRSECSDKKDIHLDKIALSHV